MEKGSKTKVSQTQPRVDFFFAGNDTHRSVAALSTEDIVTRASLADPSANRSKKIKVTPLSGLYPIIYNSPNPVANKGAYLDIHDTISLVRKAYFRFALLRNTIDIMTELANSELYLEGGKSASTNFVKAWLERVNIWKTKDKFFREYFRSSNVFFLKLMAKFNDKDISKMKRAYGSSGKEIPLRYIVLNPEDVKATAASTFVSMGYVKALTAYEVERLRNPKTKEDKDILANLPDEVKKQIKAGGEPYIPLDPENLVAIFYKKQDYEAFAVPMAYSVLGDIELYLSMQQMDASLTKTADWAILLMTMGESPVNGGVGINPENVKAMRALFQNESVKRVLVADWTTKGQWLIPEGIAQILGPTKYEEVNRNIRQGLNVILAGDEKFANSMMRVQLFMERLKEARKAFLNEFLIPEIKSVCEEMGFSDYPTPVFEEIDLKDENLSNKFYAQLGQLGILTPDEVINAVKTGQLPTQDSSLESQKKFAKLRKSGLYMPVVTGGKTDPNSAGGRPNGAKAPQSTKKISPVGTKSKASFGIDLTKLHDLYKQADKVLTAAKTALASRFGTKDLSKEQSDIAFILCKQIFANETPETWEAKLPEYLAKPIRMTAVASSEIDEIASELGIDAYNASLVRYCKKELSDGSPE